MICCSFDEPTHTWPNNEPCQLHQQFIGKENIIMTATNAIRVRLSQLLGSQLYSDHGYYNKPDIFSMLKSRRSKVVCLKLLAQIAVIFRLSKESNE